MNSQPEITAAADTRGPAPTEDHAAHSQAIVELLVRVQPAHPRAARLCPPGAVQARRSPPGPGGPEGAQVRFRRPGQGGGAPEQIPHVPGQPPGRTRPHPGGRPARGPDRPGGEQTAQAPGRDPARAPVDRRALPDRGALPADGVSLRGSGFLGNRPPAVFQGPCQVVRDPQFRARAHGRRQTADRLCRPAGQERPRCRPEKCSGPPSPPPSPAAAPSSGRSSAPSTPSSASEYPPRTRAPSSRWSTASSRRRSNARRATSTSNRSRSTSACGSARTGCSSTTTTSRPHCWGR